MKESEDKMNKKSNKLVVLLLLASLLMTLVPASQQASAADVPTAVIGRVLTPAQTGDNANWVEIAQYGNQSLIVRTKYVNTYPQAIYYNVDAWQYISFGVNNVYGTSRLREYINKWFNGNSSVYGDNLSTNARLRRFTVTNNAKSVLGTASDEAGLSNGYSIPNNAQQSFGDDIAFALSYTEAVNFVSMIYYTWQNNYRNSPDIARKNFANMTIPIVSTYCTCGAWLRSPGYSSAELQYVGSLGSDASVSGRVFQFYITNQYDTERGFIYPALWVNSGIFYADNCTITYYPNYGVGAPDPLTVPYDTDVNLSSTTPTRSGYTFAGWDTSASATTVRYRPGERVHITANLNLYAVWTPAPETRTVTGYVWPMVTQELTSGFKAKHDITIELRPTFRVQAPASRTTKAVLVNSDGLGQFTIPDVPYGTYILYIYRPGYLIRCMEVTISASSPSTVALAPPGTADNGVFNLWWGDVNGDYSVDNFDVMILLTHMANGVSANHIAYDAATDMNADGRPDNGDIMLVLNMWGKTIRNYPGAEYINYYI